MYDVAVVGGGIAGMATAARLQAQGLTTIVLEAHGQPGGCAGFFRRRGLAFDVGATTLVDFEPGGVGGELLQSIGMGSMPGEALPGYCVWLPDRTVVLYRATSVWQKERLQSLGDTPAHRRFWDWLDRLTEIFWNASRNGIKLPVQRPVDLFRAIRCVGLRHLPLARYLNWTVGDALRACGLRHDKPLLGLLSMLVEDTVHATVDDAPLVNGALGLSIRGAGLTRARGGMYGFWRRFVANYRRLGGILSVGCTVQRVGQAQDAGFVVQTRHGKLSARQVVCAVPAPLAARVAPPEAGTALAPYLERNASAYGGALVVFLGVPENEVEGRHFTHHQLLQDYDQPLGNGNNMFVSVSSAGDLESAPHGHRSVMISTHCDLHDWERLAPKAYQTQKRTAGELLIRLARRVYPKLGQNPLVCEIATPRTYERFTHRPRGAVGGVRQTLSNSNQNAIPHDIGVPGFWLAGDTTWPGLGTVACVLGSRVVAEGVLATLPRTRRKPRSDPVPLRRREAPHAHSSR